MNENEEPPIPIQSGIQRRVRHIFYGTDGLRAGWSLCIWVMCFGIIAGVSLAVARPFLQAHASPKGAPTQQSFMLIGEAVSVFSMLVATFAMSRFEKHPFGAYGLGSKSGLKNFVAGSGWGICCLLGLIAALHSGGWLIFDERLLFGAAIFRSALVWAIIFILLGFFEENMLRGYAQFTSARGIGFWPAAFLLSFVFGAVHKNNAGESPIGLASAGLIGLVFCFSLLRTGNLWWAIGFHAAWDWGESFLFGVPNSGTVMQGRLFAVHTAGSKWISGGGAGPEGSIFIVVVVAVAATIVHFTLRANKPDTAEMPEPEASPRTAALR